MNGACDCVCVCKNKAIKQHDQLEFMGMREALNERGTHFEASGVPSYQ